MTDTNRIVFEITPQPALKLAPGSIAVKWIPEDCPVSCGLPRRSFDQPLVKVSTMKKNFPDLYEILGGKNYKPRKRRKEIRYGCPHSLSVEGLRLKRTMEKREKYRLDLFRMAKETGFELPNWGWALYFYIPMPVSWSQKKRNLLKGQPNWQKPDIKNYLSILEDAISKTDEKNTQMSGIGKFWVDKMYVDEKGKKQAGIGYIEILLNQPVYNPFSVELINQDALKLKPKRRWTKRAADFPYKRKPKVKPLKIDKRFKNDNLK